MIRMMNGPDAFTGPVNLGNPEEFTVLDLANLVIEMTESKSEVIHKDLPADDPIRRQPDTTLAEEHLHWKPQIPLRKGLQHTIDWFRQIDWDDYRPPTPNY